jgi:hypothetical protein
MCLVNLGPGEVPGVQRAAVKKARPACGGKDVNSSIRIVIRGGNDMILSRSVSKELTMLPSLFLIFSLFGFGLHLISTKPPRTKNRIVELLLLYLLSVNIGFWGILAWYGHTFMADEIAGKIGWGVGSPFQFEVAVADLSWGVCGVLCIWLRNGFWTATGIGSSVFLLGCAVGHVRNMIQSGNTALYNAGPVLWIADVGVPLTILILLLIRSGINDVGGRQQNRDL